MLTRSAPPVNRAMPRIDARRIRTGSVILLLALQLACAHSKAVLYPNGDGRSVPPRVSASPPPKATDAISAEDVPSKRRGR
jgi:hypothetical protein